MGLTAPKKVHIVEEDEFSLERHLQQQTFLNQVFPCLNKFSGKPISAISGNNRMQQQQEKRDDDPLRIEDVIESNEQEEASKKNEDEIVAKQKFMTEMIQNSGIKVNTVHGMIIDAGSTGSRMHVYEFAPRIIENEIQVEEAVAGNILSYPGTESRWTERLRPGVDTFADIQDKDELYSALEDYLRPLVEFAKTILHSKETMWEIFPIYFKATAGMRKLSFTKRQRLMKTIRDIFYNKTFCPFRFELEFARVISGEEEAIYGWTAVNFLKGSLLTDSAGTGTVISPNRTFGALDLGGASTQISFYDPKEDIMSSLFKLQIGPGKHWNLYAHSFLQFGLNSAFERLNARLYAESDPEDVRRYGGVYNPCLPENSFIHFTSAVQIGNNGIEDWSIDGSTYSTIIRNDNHGADYQKCHDYVKGLLRVESNAWCNFEHGNDCSFAGVYQPPLPIKSFEFGYFVGFSNIHHAWDFLGLDEISTLDQLHDRTKTICAMNLAEVTEYNLLRKKRKRFDEDELPRMCFLGSYVYCLLHHGYGFHKSNSIMAVHAVNGNKVTWALGSMLYEINTLPWKYERGPETKSPDHVFFFGMIGFLLTCATLWIMYSIYGMLSEVCDNREELTDQTSDDTSSISKNDEKAWLLIENSNGRHATSTEVPLVTYGSANHVHPQDRK